MRLVLSVSIAVAMLGCRQSAPAPEPAAKTEAAAGMEKKKTRRNRPRGESGKFDFYVLSMSWSPGFCASPAGRNDDMQCGPQRSFAFVLHGLWPQYEQRGWPQNCSAEPLDQASVDAVLDVMPSRRLVKHEWEKHGTCSGLSSKDFLEESEEAFRKIAIPEPYRAPTRNVMVNPEKMQREFLAANPGFPEDSFVVNCTNNGRFLQEVRVCLTKDLEGRPCNREVLRSACRSDEVIMRPVR